MAIQHGRNTPRGLGMAVVLAGIVVAVGAVALTQLLSNDEPTPQAVATAAAATPTPEPPDPDVAFTIVAAGDVLPHMNVVSDARTADGYNFSPLLAGLDPWVSGADLALCHMEVPVTPEGRQPSGYPLFATVPELVRDLKVQGWDGCSTASNHSVDQGFAGVQATIAAFNANGLGHVGTAASEAEIGPQLYELSREGRTITVAHLAATYATNGMPVNPAWSVDLIDAQRLIDQATAARAAGADMVVVSLHCCVEYQTQPTADQVQVATQLAASGVVDLIIGHHAHVPEPIELLPGGPQGNGMWVAYGLGNYISNQDQACCVAETSSGELLIVHVTATGAAPAEDEPAGPPVVTSVEYLPTTVDRLGDHHIYGLPAITSGVGSLSASEIAARLNRVTTAAGPQAQVATQPPTPTGDAPVVVPKPS